MTPGWPGCASNYPANTRGTWMRVGRLRMTGRSRAVNPDAVLTPGSFMNKFITNLTLRGKFLLVTLATMVPLAVLCFVAASLQLEKMSIARTEDEGLRWASELIAIAANVSEYREHAAAVAAGAENERSELAEHAGLIREAAAKLDELIESGDSELAVISDWSGLRPRVTSALEGTGADESRQAAMHELIADLHVKVLHVADHSALVLDPG